MTDAVVLAAGLGRRLSSAADVPKWLVPVGRTSPAEVQLEALARGGIDRVHVVVSSTDQQIRRAIRERRVPFDVDLVENHLAAERNNWWSALLALEAFQEGEGDDVVLLNSDLFASPAWFEAILEELPPSAGAALAVDAARGETIEAMKVALDDTGRTVTGIGKVGIDDPGGEYVGLAWWSRAAAAELCDELRAFEHDPTCADHWYEHAIARHIQHGATYGVLSPPSSEWVEIDDGDDLIAATDLASRPGDHSG